MAAEMVVHDPGPGQKESVQPEESPTLSDVLIAGRVPCCYPSGARSVRSPSHRAPTSPRTNGVGTRQHRPPLDGRLRFTALLRIPNAIDSSPLLFRANLRLATAQVPTQAARFKLKQDRSLLVFFAFSRVCVCVCDGM